MVSLPPRATSIGINKVKVKRVKRKVGKAKGEAKGSGEEAENPGTTAQKDAGTEEVTDLASKPISASEDILLGSGGEIPSERDFPQSPVEKYIVKRKYGQLRECWPKVLE
jgi:hypothetical protein